MRAFHLIGLFVFVGMGIAGTFVLGGLVELAETADALGGQPEVPVELPFGMGLDLQAQERAAFDARLAEERAVFAKRQGSGAIPVDALHPDTSVAAQDRRSPLVVALGSGGVVFGVLGTGLVLLSSRKQPVGDVPVGLPTWTDEGG